MRSFAIGFLAALAACGGVDGTASVGTRNGDGAPSPQFALTLDVTGSGAISGAGQTCSAHCVWQVPAGSLHLDATAAPGWQLQGWSANCSGASCDLAIAGALSLAATFTERQPLPSQAPTKRLSLKFTGGGRVISTPAGLDCTADCAVDFPKDTRVTLTAIAAAGMLFVSFDGRPCPASSCDVTMTYDQWVTVNFTPVPPPPPPGACDGLVPASIPAPVLVPMDGIPVSGTADASGTNFLFTTRPDWTSGAYDYHFVKIEDGAATELRVIHAPQINDATTYSIPRGAWSQPAGFDVIRSFNADTLFDVRAPDGSLSRTVSMSIPLQGAQTSENSEYQIAPGGGMAVMTNIWTGTTSYTVHYSRFDASGDTITADAPVDLDGAFLAGWGVDFRGNVLLLGVLSGGPFREDPSVARWLDPRGAPLTPWFSVGNVYIRSQEFFPIPGGLALEVENNISLVFPSETAAAQPPPRWLRERSALHLLPVRDGKALIALPSSHGGIDTGVCGMQIEVIAADGTTCGCVDAGAAYGLGRDGSAITSATVSGKPAFSVYPQLFR